MRKQRIILLLLLLFSGLASCSPGHLGSNVIAFLHNGSLWTVDPNGANAFEVAAQDTPIVGYSWSPNHQLLAFRALDTDFAKTSQAKQLDNHAIAGLIGDVPSIINTIGVDGGTPISVMFSNSDIRFSNTLWNASGTRLIYRQTPKLAPLGPGSALWWVSQNDQPGGIAAKTLPGSYSIPSLAYMHDMAIGNLTPGIFTSTLAGTDIHNLTHEPLAGHPLPASLERVLWQPAHHDTNILYAITPSQQSANTDAFPIQLLLRSMDRGGHTTILTACTCTQFAWSPDGNHVLYSTGSTYTVLNLKDHSSFNIVGEDGSVPYWSPDSQFLLIDSLHTLTLVRISDKQSKILLSDGHRSPKGKNTTGILPATNALLQPVANSLWAGDSRHFLFLTHNRFFWQDHKLVSGQGLYTVTIDNRGLPQDKPVIVDIGNDSQAGWTYQDANTSFLY